MNQIITKNTKNQNIIKFKKIWQPCFHFGLLFSNSMIPLDPNDPRSKWTIYKYILDNSKKCLSVISELYLSSSEAGLQPTAAYVEASNIDKN